MNGNRRACTRLASLLLRGAVVLVTTVAFALASVPSARAQEAEPAPDPLVAALDVDDDAARAAAVARLRESPDRDRLVAEALRDEGLRGRLGAHALAELADLAAATDLRFAASGLRALVRDPEVDLAGRRAAARALGKLGGVVDVSALGDAVRDLPDEATRALAAIGGAASLNALRRGAGGSPPIEALAGMALLGDASGLPALVEQVDSPDPAEAQRAVALLRWATGRELPPRRLAWATFLRQRMLEEALGAVDNDAAEAAVDELVTKARGADAAQVQQDLIAVLGDRAWHRFARAKAALVLGLAGVRSAQPALLVAVQSGEDGMVRLYAADALARVGDLSAAPDLAWSLVHDEDLDRLKAQRRRKDEFFPVDPAMARALLRIGVPGVGSRLIDFLAGDYRTRLHRDCLRALDELSGGKDFGFEPDASQPDRLLALARIRTWWADARETVPIAPRADDPGWPLFRDKVAKHVANLGAFKFLDQMRAKAVLVMLAEPARPQIEEALSHTDMHVRMGAADVLQTAGLRAAAPALARRLREETKSPARTRLLVALEACGRRWPDGRATVPAEDAAPVREALGDRDIDVRIAAARAIGVVGATSDVAVLLAARAEPGNDDPAFRFASAAGLLRLGDRSAAADVVWQLLDADVALRADAMRVLASAGVDLHGYDPDLPPEERERIVALVAKDLGVPPRGQR